MNKLLAFFAGGWQSYAVAAGLAAVLAAGATFYLTSLPYRLTIAQMERDKASDGLAAAVDALDKFTKDADAIHTAAASFGGISATLNGQLATISKDFHNATLAHPLPADCRPDAVRLHAFSAAIGAANTAAGFQPVPAVPAHP